MNKVKKIVWQDGLVVRPCDADGVVWRGDYVFCKFIHSDCRKVGDEKYVTGKYTLGESQQPSMVPSRIASLQTFCGVTNWRKNFGLLFWKGVLRLRTQPCIDRFPVSFRLSKRTPRSRGVTAWGSPVTLHAALMKQWCVPVFTLFIWRYGMNTFIFGLAEWMWKLIQFCAKCASSHVRYGVPNNIAVLMEVYDSMTSVMSYQYKSDLQNRESFLFFIIKANFNCVYFQYYIVKHFIKE